MSPMPEVPPFVDVLDGAFTALFNIGLVIGIGLTSSYLIAVLARVGLHHLVARRNDRRAPQQHTDGRAATYKQEAAQVRAREAGRNAMIAAWWLWAFHYRPPQAVIHTKDSTVSPDVTPNRHRTPSSIPEVMVASYLTRVLNTVPGPGWVEERIAGHARQLWSCMDVAKEAAPSAVPRIGERLDRCAAMISDLRTDTFDTAQGNTRPDLLTSTDPGVAAAYVDGGAEGVEHIMEAIITTRITLQEEARAAAAQEALTAQRAAEMARIATARNAHLKALRETSQRTANLDAHTDFERQFKQLED